MLCRIGATHSALHESSTYSIPLQLQSFSFLVIHDDMLVGRRELIYGPCCCAPDRRPKSMPSCIPKKLKLCSCKGIESFWDRALMICAMCRPQPLYSHRFQTQNMRLMLQSVQRALLTMSALSSKRS